MQVTIDAFEAMESLKAARKRAPEPKRKRKEKLT